MVLPRQLNAEEETITSGVRDYVGIDKLSKLIERSYPATLRMVHSDKISGTRHGTEWRIKLTEVKRFLDFGNNPNPQPHPGLKG